MTEPSPFLGNPRRVAEGSKKNEEKTSKNDMVRGD